MKRGITIMVAVLVSVGMLGMFAGGAAAQDTSVDISNESTSVADAEQTAAQDNKQSGAASADGGDADASSSSEGGDSVAAADGGDAGNAEVNQTNEQNLTQNQDVNSTSAAEQGANVEVTDATGVGDGFFDEEEE